MNTPTYQTIYQGKFLGGKLSVLQDQNNTAELFYVLDIKKSKFGSEEFVGSYTVNKTLKPALIVYTLLQHITNEYKLHLEHLLEQGRKHGNITVH